MAMNHLTKSKKVCKVNCNGVQKCSPLLFYISEWFWLRLFESHFAVRDLIPGRSDSYPVAIR